MTRKEFIDYESKYGFVQAVLELGIDTWSEEALRELAKHEIDELNYNVASHILDCLWADTSSTDLYEYDRSMGTLENVTSIESIEDIEHYFDNE